MKRSAAFDVGLWLTALTLWIYAVLQPPVEPLAVIDCQMYAAHPACRGVSQSEYVADIRSRPQPTVIAGPIEGGE